LNRSLNKPDEQSVPDRALLIASGSGDESAFRTLYQRYERRVYNYVRTFIREPTLAEDVVIETMTAVWQGAMRFTQASRASTWILGIARHKALDAVRKSGGRPEPVSLDQVDEPIGDDDPQTFAVVGADAQLMLRALALLTQEHREILRLAFYEDLPYDDIAAMLSIPGNTVKTRVFYAKQQLKLHLVGLGMESRQ
jgi:RNA polymerase sigma-70 factor (ECF subfamily)